MPLPLYIQRVIDYSPLLELDNFVSQVDKVFSKSEPTVDEMSSLRSPLLSVLQQLIALPSANMSYLSRAYAFGAGFFGYQMVKEGNTLQSLSYHERVTLRASVVAALESLASDYPLNTNDPVDLEPLEDGGPYFVSITGVNYRLSNVAQWVAYKKDFVYPLYTKRMFPEDIDKFKQQCLEHEISYAPLNESQIALAQKRESLGISEEMLVQLLVPELRINHLLLIEKLMNEQNYSIQEAIDECQGLNYEQADALFAYFDCGLRGDHLRELSIQQSEYGPHHTAALDHLITVHDMNIDEAVNTISPYGFFEVQEIYSAYPLMIRPDNRR